MPTPNGQITFKIDTGADVTVIGEEHLTKFDKQLADLKHTRKSLMGPDGKKLTCLGYFMARMSVNNKNKDQICYVCRNVKIPLLGRPAIRALEILKFQGSSNYVCASTEIVDVQNSFITRLTQKYFQDSEKSKVTQFISI